MKVLLQHTASHDYFSEDGLWRQNAAQGRSFADISFAFCFCRAHEMFSANVILAFEDADMNVCVQGPRQPTPNEIAVLVAA
jgi:hypothetical protein